MWMKGPRKRIPTPGQNARHAFFGALDAVSGVFHWVDHEHKSLSDNWYSSCWVFAMATGG